MNSTEFRFFCAFQWNISDFLNQNRVTIQEALEQQDTQSSEPARDEPALPASDRLWMALYSKMGELCVDPRPAVRKSAGQTLFSTINAHGSLLDKVTWYTVLWQVGRWVLSNISNASRIALSDMKMRAEPFVSHKARTASIFDGFKIYPFYTHLVREIFNIDVV